MLKISRLSDYAVVIMTCFAQNAQIRLNAKDIAEKTYLPATTVSKLLKILVKSNILTSAQGKQGGYSLSRRADEITIEHIIEAIDGPIALTRCTEHNTSTPCELTQWCPVKDSWQRINQTVASALASVTLADTVPHAKGVTYAENQQR